MLIAHTSKVTNPTKKAMPCRGCLLSSEVSAIATEQEWLTYSSNSASWYVLGAYKRRCFLRNSRKPPTRTAARTRHGANVDTRADMEEGPPRLLPAREDELGADILILSGGPDCRVWDQQWQRAFAVSYGLRTLTPSPMPSHHYRHYTAQARLFRNTIHVEPLL